MAKIRVQDLARNIGMAEQDLLFKLRSIGVRVEGEDAQVDTDVLKAVLEGKKLAAPREVIVRDEESPAPAPPSRRMPPGRRIPGPPPRQRPRAIVQRVEPRIQSLPPRERPEPPHTPPPPPAEAAPPSLPEPTEPREVAAAATAGAPAVETSPIPSPAPAAPEAPAVPAAKKKAKDERESRVPREKLKKGRAEVDETEGADLRGYRGKVTALDEVDEAPASGARRKRRAERREAAEAPQPEVAPQGGAITIVEGMTVREFSEKLGIMAKDLIKRLVQRGIMANINHVLEPELAEELGMELGFDTQRVSFEEEVQLRQEQVLEQGEEREGKVPRAPVVTIMGHVDHGKTTLLDAFRSSRLVEAEHGGITQHIGAYEVHTAERKIVFLDTPGHEAFTQLRARGAKATDLVVLVVAADDGVMPQTVEAIDHARAAGVPIVVAVNKIDKANANPDRVKKELSERGLMPEDWGGDTVTVHISALKGEGTSDLLDMILLTADLLELKADPDLSAQGIVIEARKEVGRGVVASVLVQDGTLSVGDIFVSGATWGRVRSMTNDLGERLAQAGPATPVEVTGFQDVPDAGDLIQVVKDEPRARSIAEFRHQEQRRRELAPAHGKLSLEQLFGRIEVGEVKDLPVVLKADVQGSVEVLHEALQKLSTEKVKVTVIHAGVGAVTTNDVLLASASGAVVIGFNVRPERKASELADKEGVDVRLHTVIYELTDELKKAMAGLLEPVFEETSKGRAEVREVFRIPKVGTVAGCHVVEGVVPRNAQARLLRDNVVVYDGRIASLRRFKEDVSEVRTGYDCGIGLERFQDVKPGDQIEAYAREAVAQTL